MKKLNYLLLGLAGLSLASCANEDFQDPGANASGENTVTIQLSMPEIGTRTYSDGLTAKNLQYTVYDVTEGRKQLKDAPYTIKNATMDGLTKSVEFKLAEGRQYDFVFWASAPDSPYEVTFSDAGASLNVDYAKATANKDELDAFFAYVEPITVKGSMSSDAELKRPFAQINLLTNDYNVAEKIDFAPSHSTVTIRKAYETLDLISGAVSDEKEVTFALGEINKTGETNNTKFSDEHLKGYNFLNMVYVLTSADQEIVELEYTWQQGTNGTPSSLTVGSVPVQRNYRTNIYGELLTNPVNINIEILPDFDNSENILVDKEIFSGVTYDASIKTFYISNAEGLMWLSKVSNKEEFKVNEDSPYSVEEINTITKNGAFNSLNVLFTSDINMAGENFKPIHLINEVGNLWFCGNIDGQGHTISNLTYTTTVQGQAIGFVASINGDIKNLKIDNANFTGINYIGGVVGKNWGNIINCEVSNSNLKANVHTDKGEGADIGGIVGYLPDTSGYIEGCKVSNTTIKGCRDVGGVVGKYQGIASSTTNKISDCILENVQVIMAWPEGYKEDNKLEKPDNKQEGKTCGPIAGYVMYHSVPSTNLDGSSNPDNNILKNVKVFVLDPTEFTVVEKESDFKSALSEVENGDVIFVTAPVINLEAKFTENKSYTIQGLGADKTILKAPQAYNNANGAEITLEDLTLESFVSNANHTSLGFDKVAKINLNNVKLVGEYHVFAGSEANITNCEFNYFAESKSANLLWLESDKPAVIENCIFDNSYAAAAVLICKNIWGNIPRQAILGDITFKNCTFKAARSSARAALEIHSELFLKAGTLKIDNCEMLDNNFNGGLWREIDNTNGQKTNFFKVMVNNELKQEGGHVETAE